MSIAVFEKHDRVELDNRWIEDMSNWAVPAFSRNQVDKAGFTLIDPTALLADKETALTVINNWRSSHSYPLINFRNNLRRKIQNIQNDAIIAQRIKRLQSIEAKLVRQTTQLSQMQDIGGCRSIRKC
jgi:(p)ppGpp synthase/HD superfamily hydrolase